MSPTRRSGLGKGLSSLIPADVETDGSTFREIDVDAVVPNRYQPRDHFDEETLSSLAASIAEVGVIQPIVVRATDEGYELIAGSGDGERLVGPICRRFRDHSRFR